MTSHREWEDTGSQLAGLGAISALEARLENMYGLPYALAVSSATSGLLALGIVAELAAAEFVTTAYTWGGTVAPFMMLGGRPVFADIDPGTLTLDPRSVERAITENTRAIVSVDVHGNPADDASLREIANRHGVLFIADSAQGFGATREGRPASVLADALVLSFSTGKSLAAGEGGAILTSHPDIYERLLLLTQHPSRVARELGMARRTEHVPLNARMHPAAATRLVAEWDAALASLPARQAACFEILEALAAAGLARDDHLKDRHLVPAFTHLTAASSSDEPDLEELTSTLDAVGHPAWIEPAPAILVYEQPGFPAEFRPAAGCLNVMLDQATRRLLIDRRTPARRSA